VFIVYSQLVLSFCDKIDSEASLLNHWKNADGSENPSVAGFTRATAFFKKEKNKIDSEASLLNHWKNADGSENLSVAGFTRATVFLKKENNKIDSKLRLYMNKINTAKINSLGELVTWQQKNKTSL
jgi:hypothetical protein